MLPGKGISLASIAIIRSQILENSQEGPHHCDNEQTAGAADELIKGYHFGAGL
jgi:hypothetical protein